MIIPQYINDYPPVALPLISVICTAKSVDDGLLRISTGSTCSSSSLTVYVDSLKYMVATMHINKYYVIHNYIFTIAKNEMRHFIIIYNFKIPLSSVVQCYILVLTVIL